MASAEQQENHDEEEGGDWIGLGVAIAAVAALGAFWLMSWQLAFLLTSVVVISIVIWQACDPFADAAQWIGTTLGIPGSVRGATLDAISSSLPELFSGIFFVVIAISAVQGNDPAAIEAAGAEGFGSTIATCAGSAVYNMILIPAIVTMTIAFYRRTRPTIDVEDEVLARDGIWFLLCELALLVFLFQNKMYWWMGLVLMGMYVVYICQLYRDTIVYRKRLHALKEYFTAKGLDTPTPTVISELAAQNVKVHYLLVDKIREEIKEGSFDENEDEDEEEAPEGAGALFGFVEIPLSHVTAWLIILVSTVVAVVACYFLVESTRHTAVALNVPTFFVAVILAAAASSVPDTFLSIGSAMRGDDSGAVSNAFGSNIFDICICLSVPLLVNSYLVNWGPVSLTQDGEPIAGLVGLRISLFVLTGVTLAIMWHNRQLTFRKSLVLCGLYGLFIAYAVLGSLGMLEAIGL
ncbi:hypothetical protein LOC68_09375 [Blastopirellula sp. JC732]|uniref:Sodium/calcium exchanger membrane region domain-containing protein n=1 Tax=Blastopirellula sediminis TaxID=2894196 RepID=A0A9X1MLN4_9BACT|nr:hypothetical protein [Blastopirellula sediminis]MCC9608616.1 hypothetical protein [Blastopirellula sediminis]MCC9628607.1 hypothetical protein [Blastopirellula sediminis]